MSDSSTTGPNSAELVWIIASRIGDRDSCLHYTHVEIE